MEKRIGFKSFHYGWIIVIVTFLTLLVSAGIRSIPSVLMISFQTEFGWSRTSISGVISIGILLYGLTGPFSAALLQKYGIRKVIVISLTALVISLAVTPFMTALWQYEILWGAVTGLATGMMANVLGVTVSNQWFVKRKGLIVGLLTASAATGQLLFLPLMAKLTEEVGWRQALFAACCITLFALIVVAIWMRNHPSHIGLPLYGEGEVVKPTPFKGNIFLTPIKTLGTAWKSRAFWLLAGTFFFCGFSTNGLIGTHFIPAGHDHGIPEVTSAGLLALMGIFDLVGTTLSGWLSDRYDSRKLLFWYYGLRGLSLLFLPYAFEGHHAFLLLFSVFYGLDWIATVPPTVKLATNEFGKANSGMIFGWIVVFHQIGASVAAYGGGILRDTLGSYNLSFLSAGAVCLLSALLVLRISKVDIMTEEKTALLEKS